MNNLKLRSRQWIVNEKGQMVMGEGRMRILKTIDRTGSINKTAKLLRMSYKAVWSKIKATESHLNFRLVQADGRRGSRVTEAGKDLLQKYTLLKEQCVEADDQIFREIFQQP
ncbi:MAG: winged helix-turn-helix domain-containing protein [Desulfobacteraceae bacterium]